MDADLTNRLITEIHSLKHARDELSSRLDLLDPCSRTILKRNSRRSGNYYYVKPEGSASFKYTGKEEVTVVQRIKEAVHLDQSISVIDNNIKLIDDLLNGYMPHDFTSVDPLLPKTYRSEIRIDSSPYYSAGTKWKTAKLRFQSQFPENFPENKTERTADGIWVKSKNEVIIYNKILDAGLFLIYELPLPSADYGPPLYPDFTVLSPVDLETEIIVEHVGRLDRREYREDFARRIYRYLLNGYIPCVNLFFTFNDIDGHLDALQVNKIINDILDCR